MGTQIVLAQKMLAAFKLIQGKSTDFRSVGIWCIWMSTKDNMLEILWVYKNQDRNYSFSYNIAMKSI